MQVFSFVYENPGLICNRQKFSRGIFRWGGRPWPPIVLAGTEARPTKIFLFSPEPQNRVRALKTMMLLNTKTQEAVSLTDHFIGGQCPPYILFA